LKLIAHANFADITLGAGTLDAVNEVIADKSLNKPMEFVATRVAVCQLGKLHPVMISLNLLYPQGNFGTCRKILFEMPPLNV
jgi:hypothetical protein